MKKVNMEKLIERINYLYKKSQEEGLTEEEKKEQEKVRREYIDNIKKNFKAQLNTVKKKS
ncbi:DUF896 domain-containing protein [Clostridium sp.]|uniref:DUF896 domain-containing protein n=1 Tax=Clostridium sp. TaxID=1506 RepID=UPI003464DE96